jgi:hypothetical protein
MVVAHHTRFTRFLITPMLFVWIAAAAEIGAWTRAAGRVAGALAAGAVTIYGAAAAHAVLAEDRFRQAAFENYTDSPALTAALDGVRAEAGATGPIAVLGRSDQVSPGLMRLRLGPPSGGRFFPVEVLRNADVPALLDAPFALLLAPGAPARTSPEISSDYPRDAARLQPLIESGRFLLVRRYPVDDPSVQLELYRAPPR